MLGTLQIVEVRSVEIEVLANGARLRSLGDSIVASLGLAVLGEPQWHAFPPREDSVGGHTGLWLLAESHLALHSFPELRALTIEASNAVNITQMGMAHASQIISLTRQANLKYHEIPVNVLYTPYSRNKGQTILNSVNIIADLVWSET